MGPPAIRFVHYAAQPGDSFERTSSFLLESDIRGLDRMLIRIRAGDDKVSRAVLSSQKEYTLGRKHLTRQLHASLHPARILSMRVGKDCMYVVSAPRSECVSVASDPDRSRSGVWPRCRQLCILNWVHIRSVYCFLCRRGNS